jgi:hypothetical protein
MNMRREIARHLPNELKATIRACMQGVRQAVHRAPVDHPSTLAIGTFGGFEMAYRKNTADESVIGHIHSVVTGCACQDTQQSLESV